MKSLVTKHIADKRATEACACFGAVSEARLGGEANDGSSSSRSLRTSVLSAAEKGSTGTHHLPLSSGHEATLDCDRERLRAATSSVHTPYPFRVYVCGAQLHHSEQSHTEHLRISGQGG